jgi:hypothetical protein
MGLFARLFAANPEELEQLNRDARAYLEKNSQELERELLARKQQHELTINILRKDSKKK